jgi:DNA-binding beta-propeller fold protein YncE
MLRRMRRVAGLLILVLLLPLPSAGAESITPSFDRFVGESGLGAGEFEGPADIAVDEDGNFWVVDTEGDRVQEFNAEGKFTVKVGWGGPHELSEPSAIAVSSGHVWVADTGHNRIEEFNLEGEFIRAAGSFGSEAGEFWEPEGIAVDQEGHVWVADTANGRIQELSETGEFIREAGGSPPGESGPLALPTGIAVAPNGQIWVTDWLGGRIAVFSSSGELLRRFGAKGYGRPGLRRTRPRVRRGPGKFPS